MPRETLIPPEVLRALSLLPSIRLSVEGDPPASGRFPCAPYEDALFVFVNPGHPVEKRLLEDTRAELRAAPEDGSWSARMTGRAIADRRGNAHPRRMELGPWLPEGKRASQYVIATFWAEEIEYHRGEERFSGQTPAGKAALPPGKRWFRAAFDGVLPVLFLAIFGPAMWFGVKGADTPLRFIGTGVSMLSAVMLLAAGRLWVRQAWFLRYREGKGKADEILGAGWVAPVPVFQAAVASAVVGTLLSLASWIWGGDVLVATWLCSGSPVLWPVWLTKIHRGEDEDDPG